MSNVYICSKCGKTVMEINCWLKRTNEKGKKPVMQCSPYCGATLTQEESVVQSVLGPGSSMGRAVD